MQTRKEKLERLRQEMLCLQGLDIKSCHDQQAVPLGPVLDHMPGGIFPTGVIHEFLSPTYSASAAANGFISAVISYLMQNDMPCLWISRRRTIFPPSLKLFGIDSGKIIFIDVPREKEVLWVMEEALKCRALNAVVAEIKELDFTHSRRLQLAVENSRVTGFVHRLGPRRISPTASVTRWQVYPVNSHPVDGLPGVGFPRWKVELLKVRNGRPGCWELEWAGHAFQESDLSTQTLISPAYKTGAA